MTLLCSAHASDPKVFDWRRVNIRTTRYERAIIDRDFTDDLCETQLREQRSVEKSYMEFWQGLRAKLDPFLGSGPVNRPRSYHHAAEIARTGKVLSGLGKPLYQRGSKTSLDDAGIKAFMDACPPFRAICYGLVGTWFDVSLAPHVFKKLAGRNDQMMAVYLPYCSRFVTADGKQETRLREIAVEASLDCEILSCNDFLASLEVLA